MGKDKIFLLTVSNKSFFVGLLYLLTILMLSCTDSVSEKDPTTALPPDVSATVAKDSESLEAEPEVKTLRIGIGAHLLETESLVNDHNFRRLIWSGLLTSSADGRLQPDAAAFLPSLANEGVSSDQMTYTIRLVSDSQWSDTGRISSQQIVELIQMKLNSLESSYLSQLVSKIDIANINAIDSLTIIFPLFESCPEFLTLLSLPEMFPERVIQAESAALIPVNGPYRVMDWSDARVVLTRNDMWPDRFGVVDSHAIERIEFVPFSNFEDAYRKFREGEIDLLPATSEQKRRAGVTAEELINVEPQIPFTYSVFVNNSDDTFDETAARRSLAMNLSRNDLLSDMADYDTASVKPIYSWIPEQQWGFNELHFVSLAETNLLPADDWYIGVGEGDVEFELLYSSNDPFQTRLAPLLKKHWESTLPVDVNLREERTEEYYADIVSGAYQLAIGQWTTEVPYEADWLSVFHSSHPDNFLRFSESGFDDLIESFETVREREDWDDAIYLAHERLMAEVGLIPLFVETGTILGTSQDIALTQTMLRDWDWDSLFIQD